MRALPYPTTATTTLLFLLLSLLSLLTPVLSFGRSSSYQQPPGKNAILLSKVHSLTLRANKMTTARRLPPIPQLTCTGPSKRICDLSPIDTMRCVNQGSDYDDEDVQWTCTASLPPEFKLGATDVVCEGYRSAEDPWVLKGSCGVEYRLLLTELGERRFGHLLEEEKWERWWSEEVGGWVIVGLVALCVGLILYPLVADCLGFRRNDNNNRRGGNNNNGRPWWGGFWPGGGGGGGGGGHDPPPPYDYPSSNPFVSSTSSSSSGWRPGFWTGALGGAAAGYELGRRSRERTSGFWGRPAATPFRTTRYYDYDDAGEGSSASAVRFSSTTTTSTGFGSTRRR